MVEIWYNKSKKTKLAAAPNGAAASFFSGGTAMKKLLGGVLSILLAIGMVLFGPQNTTGGETSFSLEDVPAYSGDAYVVLNGGVPEFSPEELGTAGREEYAPLDALGRCGPAFAVVGVETMPTAERESIGQVKPSGWQTAKYDCVDGKYLYNRCHLIGYQLTGENANKENLITGTRYLNIDGMLSFENQIAEYVERTENHVAFRVTPIFVGDELVARGVEMEAQSVEDQGAGLSFHIYAYNVQPGVVIDYATGASHLEDKPEETGQTNRYILNTKSGKFHLPECSGVKSISEENKKSVDASYHTMVDSGYDPCGQCKPAA